MRENENTNPHETLKRLRAGFFFFFFNGKGWVKFGYIIFGFNGLQWVFSSNPIITGSNWVDANLTQLIIGWVWVQLEWVSLDGQMTLDLLCHSYSFEIQLLLKFLYSSNANISISLILQLIHLIFLVTYSTLSRILLILI